MAITIVAFAIPAEAEKKPSAKPIFPTQPPIVPTFFLLKIN